MTSYIYTNSYSQKVGRGLNRRKTEVTVVPKWVVSKCAINVNFINVGQVRTFKYLATWIT